MADLRTRADVEAENALLRRAIETVTTSFQLDDVLRSAVELVTQATGGDACFLHLWDPQDESLVLRAASARFEEAVGVVRLSLGEGIAGWVAQHREVVVIPEDKWNDPRYKYIPELRGEEFVSMLSVPVVSRAGDLVGVFNVHARKRRDFGSHEVQFLRLIASLVAEAIEHASLFRALADKEADLEGLVSKTIEAQEEERRRVATEIHDGVTQQLVSIWYRLIACERSLRSEPDRAEVELAAARALVDEALTEARAAIYDLRPALLDDLGLSPSIRTLVLRQMEGEAEVDLAVEDVVRLAPHQEVAVYRIAQEAVTNIRKHAAARRVRVGLRDLGSEVLLTIEDDGRGFDVKTSRPQGAQTSFGLTGMDERAALIGGSVAIRSSPGHGTTLEVRIPRQEQDAAR